LRVDEGQDSKSYNKQTICAQINTDRLKNIDPLNWLEISSDKLPQFLIKIYSTYTSTKEELIS